MGMAKVPSEGHWNGALGVVASGVGANVVVVVVVVGASVGACVVVVVVVVGSSVVGSTVVVVGSVVVVVVGSVGGPEVLVAPSNEKH